MINGAKNFQTVGYLAKLIVTMAHTVDGPKAFLVEGDSPGLGRAALEETLKYTQERVSGGELIIKHQAVGLFLADMAANLEAARRLLWTAAWLKDHPEAIEAFPFPTRFKITEAMAGFKRKVAPFVGVN